ncbi:DJ-1/PfpI family protein [Prosthecobacter sp.]|uniref:DJ-1/PfpI family protein n=1 Tax=Prosthecobacter sp. TaxID=1965333 RepID=UPI002486D359|nr:DJ-1/PfpI family protein [Prosthecobacter sp.]MDI1313755.1 DJ-1/PfpI family protein [Prosthecobacter sp.]
MNVGIFIFNDIEVLDLGGPFEVFSVATRVKARLEPGSLPPFNVFAIGETTIPIRTRGGLIVTPNHSFADHPRIDLLIIPGGIVSAELTKETVISWITATAAQAKTIASVCTGSFLLAKTGLLNGKRATTHWEDIDDMQSMFPQVTVEKNVRWVEQENIITSAGISAGIDMSLHLVSRLDSESLALALATAKQMDYRWLPNNDDSTPKPLMP